MTKVWGWACGCVSLSVAGLSSLIGMAPRVAEDPAGNPIRCGATLFHTGARPSPMCDTEPDLWRWVAEGGLFAAIGRQDGGVRHPNPHRDAAKRRNAHPGP